MSERFYVNHPLAPGEVKIEGAEAHHLAQVCRFRPGDQVYLFNGNGHEYRGTVQHISRRSVVLQVLTVETPARELGVRLEVAAPLPKGDRAQFLLEKLTEIGATRFVPLRTKRSVVHPGEGKRERLQRYVIEASKQCGRNTLLEVVEVADWESYCRRTDLPPVRWLADPRGADDFQRERQDAVLAVGPEGGFAEEEIERARQSGWHLVRLGSRTLRIETAALVLAARITGWD